MCTALTGRVSVFVGPENVALYRDEDVINWGQAQGVLHRHELPGASRVQVE